jgi:5'-nucleotidase
MHILITNDDGIAAPGLAALIEAASRLGEVTVVAPVDHKSGCSHAATTDEPLRVIEQAPRRLAVTGTPVDCVRLALMHLAPAIDLVLSGVNDGGNLGVDLFMSGTVAAVREGALLGRPGVALSQYRRRGRAADWVKSSRWTAAALEAVFDQAYEPRTFWNVNLPDSDTVDTPPVIICRPNPEPLPIRYEPADGAWHYRGDYHARPRLADCDVGICFGGNIAASRVSLW